MGDDAEVADAVLVHGGAGLFSDRGIGLVTRTPAWRAGAYHDYSVAGGAAGRQCFLLLLVALLSGCGRGGPGVAPATPPAGPAPAATPAAPAAPASPTAAAEPPPLYFTVMDANAAFARKDFSTALQLYRRAAADDSLGATRFFVHRVPPGPELRAFARFRIVVADALVGQEDDARATLEQARRQDTNTPFLRLDLVFWDTYGMTADPHAAC